MFAVRVVAVLDYFVPFVGEKVDSHDPSADFADLNSLAVPAFRVLVAEVPAFVLAFLAQVASDLQ